MSLVSRKLFNFIGRFFANMMVKLLTNSIINQPSDAIKNN
ncbi:Uncharacterised protein [Legionella beliardensis]|uniref:Uncharacterized protein n=1 Tax=Legionella beliardensis TaxID=91822 RepID=A0A378I4Y9_9GAMM|nr:Uncharacterised protein [Legionella beliardensis]